MQKIKEQLKMLRKNEKEEENGLEYILKNNYNFNENDIEKFKKSLPNIARKFRVGINKNTGLAIGEVQSGKTLFIEAFIWYTMKTVSVKNKRLITILLTGNTNNLNKQAETRIIEDYKNLNNKNMKIIRFKAGSAIDLEDKIKESIGENKNLVILLIKNKRGIKFVKEKLSDEIKSLSKYKWLIVDDEADHFTPNGKIRKKGETQLYKELKEFRKSICNYYLGITATPFLNLLVSNKSMQKPDYLYKISPGKGYMGLAELMKNESKYIKVIDNIQTKKQEDLYKDLPEVVLTFILTIAVRRKIKDKSTNTMLINIGTENRLHQQTEEHCREIIELYKLILKQKNFDCLISENKNFLQLLENCIKNISNAHILGDIYEIRKYILEEIIENIEIRIVNKSNNYIRPNNTENIIYIGGLVVSRGLTIDGLVISFIARHIPQYGVHADTYLQYCRWLGYFGDRGEYVKIFMTQDIKNIYNTILKMQESTYISGDNSDKNRMIIEKNIKLPTRKNAIDADIYKVKDYYKQNKFKLSNIGQKKNEKLIGEIINKYKNNKTTMDKHMVFKDIPIYELINFLNEFKNSDLENFDSIDIQLLIKNLEYKTFNLVFLDNLNLSNRAYNPITNKISNIDVGPNPNYAGDANWKRNAGLDLRIRYINLSVQENSNYVKKIYGFVISFPKENQISEKRIIKER